MTIGDAAKRPVILGGGARNRPRRRTEAGFSAGAPMGGFQSRRAARHSSHPQHGGQGFRNIFPRLLYMLAVLNPEFWREADEKAVLSRV